MAEIARRAGVGMATLYRNFPGQRELLEALFVEEVDAICAAAERLADARPDSALFLWLDQVYDFLTSKHKVGSALLKQSDRGNPAFSQSRDRVLAAGRPLLAAAQRAKTVRDDLVLEQILDMIAAITTIDADPAYRRPILGTALDGLRP